MLIRFTNGGRLPVDIERKRRVMTELAKRGMTITQLADLAGFSQSYASVVISGQKRSRSAEEKMAMILRMPVGFLFPARTLSELMEMSKGAA